MINRALAQSIYFTRYLLERDALSVCMTRFGSGFTPASSITSARLHVSNIQKLVEQMEELAEIPKHQIVAKDYNHLIQRSCCGRD